jgi:hypothetical protein
VNIERAAGAFLIVLQLAFNAFFFLLARRFDYPTFCAAQPRTFCGAKRDDNVLMTHK